MKKEQLEDIIGMIDDDLITEKKKMNNRWKTISFIAAAALILVGVGFSIAVKTETEIVDGNAQDSNYKNAVDAPLKEKIISENEIISEGEIDQMVFLNLIWNGYDYGSSGYVIPEKQKGAKIGSSEIKDRKENLISVDLYAINSISPEFAVAVDFKNGESLYCYIAYSVDVHNMQEVMDALSLQDNLLCDWVEIFEEEDGKQKTTDYVGISKQDVLEKLIYIADDLSQIEVYDNMVSEHFKNNDMYMLDIRFSLPIIGQNNYAMMIYENGEVCINAIPQCICYNVGPEKAAEFANWVKENLTVLVPPEEMTSGAAIPE